MPELSTTYLGLKLRNPIVAAASPLSDSIASMQRLEEAGAAAIVMSSLFEEQIEYESHALDHYLSYGSESYGESTTYFPEIANFNIGPQQHIDLIAEAKKKISIPIIASLNGCSPSGWTEWSRLVEQAGADAIELNEYYLPTDINMTGVQVEERYLAVLKMVKQQVSIPVSVKLNPYFSSTANMCKRLVECGADGLVLFNRFYQPDIDLENLEVLPHLVLSSPQELNLPLRWVAVLYGRLKADLAVTSGVQSSGEVLKAMMVGASIAMMASELLRHGPDRIKAILADLDSWMEKHDYHSITQMRGSMSQINLADPAAFERANYMKVLKSWHPVHQTY
ncbi:MAG: dihydroorotate dehydrogenase-like protein [Candidatus Melainabacteria bacterium]|nr:dihydroorotate dehydrogenase-like protein [Candidatus Melainabacteria bacterium]